MRCVLTLVCCAMLGSAFGQQTSREQEQLRRLRQQLQQLQQGQTAQQEAAQRAQAEAAATQGRLDAARAQLAAAQSALRRARSEAATQAATQAAQAATQAAILDAAQKEADALRQQQATLKSERDRLQADLQASARSNEQLRAAGSDLQRRLARADAAQTDLTGRHLLQAQGLQTCIASNLALRDIGQELMQRYASKTVADVLAENEPFLAWRRVRMENLLQDYQDKLDQSALKAAAPGRAAAPVGELSSPETVRGR